MMKEKSQYKIYLDGTDRNHSVVTLLLVKDEKETVLERREGLIDLVSEIDGILKKHKLSPSDVAYFDYHAGPGSFTGLKISAAIANTFNWALNKKQLNELKYPEYGREPNITISQKNV
jgi:tRNA A37 threonylcarbamoyladenosine modification protein TsaB